MKKREKTVLLHSHSKTCLQCSFYYVKCSDFSWPVFVYALLLLAQVKLGSDLSVIAVMKSGVQSWEDSVNMVVCAAGGCNLILAIRCF